MVHRHDKVVLVDARVDTTDNRVSGNVFSDNTPLDFLTGDQYNKAVEILTQVTQALEEDIEQAASPALLELQLNNTAGDLSSHSTSLSELEDGHTAENPLEYEDDYIAESHLPKNLTFDLDQDYITADIPSSPNSSIMLQLEDDDTAESPALVELYQDNTAESQGSLSQLAKLKLAEKKESEHSWGEEARQLGSEGFLIGGEDVVDDGESQLGEGSGWYTVPPGRDFGLIQEIVNL